MLIEPNEVVSWICFKIKIGGGIGRDTEKRLARLIIVVAE